ncbi:hypothetical protein [Methylobacterium currus]|nr:hypothetical protein [Methylobacterium currus]
MQPASASIVTAVPRRSWKWSAVMPAAAAVSDHASWKRRFAQGVPGA